MTTFDAPGRLCGPGIITRKWTDLRQEADNSSSPAFRPWLISKKPRNDTNLNEGDFEEYFKSREECRKMIGQYQKIQNALIPPQDRGSIDYLC